jgi:hypothetical protein
LQRFVQSQDSYDRHQTRPFAYIANNSLLRVENLTLHRLFAVINTVIQGALGHQQPTLLKPLCGCYSIHNDNLDTDYNLNQATALIKCMAQPRDL